jgi:hypothetical protein
MKSAYIIPHWVLCVHPTADKKVVHGSEEKAKAICKAKIWGTTEL